MARAILSQHGYRLPRPTTSVAPKESFWEFVLNWLVDHVLRPLFDPIGHALGASRGVGAVFGFILIGLALAGLAYVVVRLVLAFAPRFTGRGDDASDIRSLDEQRTQRDSVELAREAAAAGDYRRAIGYLFSAALALLDDRELIVFDAARTPGEYRRLVRRTRGDASSPFDTLADRFVRATYAEASPERADFDVAERALAELEPLVRA